MAGLDTGPLIRHVRTLGQQQAVGKAGALLTSMLYVWPVIGRQPCVHQLARSEGRIWV